MEISFQSPYYLILLVSIPLLVITHYYSLKHTKRKAMKFANFEALKRVTGEHLITKNITLLIIRVLFLIVLVIGLARPVFWYRGKSNHNDFVIAIDMSASMTAEDVLPNRLEAAKESAKVFVDSLDSRTKLGLVAFAGVSFIESPLTIDINEVKRQIGNLDIMTAGGTDLGGALITSTNLLLSGDKAKSIILLTDGSDTSGFAVDENIDFGLDYLRKSHITLYAIGIGTEQGDFGNLPEELEITYSYDEEELKNMAEATGGKFFEATNNEELLYAFSEINSLTEEGNLSIDLSVAFLTISLILIFIEWGMINTKFRAVP
ncbi:VWA domain-containing protein [Candidatus Woesearchaeota archaeon]|nr:VWA domain-containing protein [Candidatus Woesearchaeota archaeon]